MFPGTIWLPLLPGPWMDEAYCCGRSNLVLGVAEGKFIRQAAIPLSWGSILPTASTSPAYIGRSDGVFVWAADTGEVVRKLGNHGGSVDWSPDGKRLAYVSDTPYALGGGNRQGDPPGQRPR